MRHPKDPLFKKSVDEHVEDVFNGENPVAGEEKQTEGIVMDGEGNIRKPAQRRGKKNEISGE